MPNTTTVECPRNWTGEKCPRCGSVSSEEFFRLSSEGAKVIRSDKRWKYYLQTDKRMLKFYTSHL